MPGCSFITCKNHSGKENKSTGITFHTFPKDELWRQKWLKIVRKQRRELHWVASNNNRICSLHFKPDDVYVTKNGLNRIKKGAVPFIQVTSDSSSGENSGHSSPNSLQNTVPGASSQFLGQQSQDHEHDNVQKSTLNVPDKQLDLKRTDYRCNECNSDIFGFRYACVQCVDHDVCATCEARGAHALHYVLRVPADKPHREVMAVLERIREVINIEKQEDQDVPLDEIESIKCEVDTSSDPLEDEDIVKEEPQEFSEFEFPQSDEEPNIKGNAQRYAPKKCQQRRKRKSSPEKHTDSPPVTLPDTHIWISLDHVTEVIAKRNKTQSSLASSKTINEQTPLNYEVPADIKPNVNAQRSIDQILGSVVPVIMYNIPGCEDSRRLRTEQIHSSATSSSQAPVVSFDSPQPVEDLVIKTED